MIIKGVKIKNLFGIKEAELSFLVKNMSKNSTLEDQVVKLNDKFYSLVPSFLAKNAAGKTSFVKALDFALRFGTKESISKEMIIYIEWILRRFHRNLIVHNTDEYYKRDRNFGIFLVKKLFNELSFAGSKELFVNVSTSEGDIKIEITPESFFVIVGKEKFNMVELINNFDFDKLNEYTFIESKKAIKSNIKKLFQDKKLYEYSFSSIFKADHAINNIDELSQKYKTKKYLNELVEFLGQDSLKTLLKKVDRNIDSVSWDIDSKNVNISLKSNPDFYITPRSLSFGTQKILEILYKSVSIFEKGGIMMIDEIENGLHLSLIQLIVSIYENPKINKANGQILFTTHNPLIFKRGIVDSINIYMEEDNNFINILNSKIIDRTENKIQVVTPKNYYNDLYWISKNVEDKTTISNFAISQVIESMSNGVKWEKR